MTLIPQIEFKYFFSFCNNFSNKIYKLTIFVFFNKINSFHTLTMSLRDRKRNYHIQSREKDYNHIIGILNPLTSIDCRIQIMKEEHKFGLNIEHPLNAITKMTRKCKNCAFQKLIQATFDIKIQQKTTFLPEALLNGNDSIIHEYKKMLQKGRIGSYIKLNIKQQSISLQKKRPMSLDINQEKSVNLKLKNIFSEKIFNENITNVKTVRKNTDKIPNENHTDNCRGENAENHTFFQDSFNNKKYTIGENSHIRNVVSEFKSNIKINVNNVNENRSREVIHHTNTQVKKSSKSSKSNKKAKGSEGIKINYTVIKNKNQNPQTSSFIFKSQVSKGHRQVSQYGPKSQIINVNFKNNQMNKTHQFNNEKSNFSVHNDKLEQHNYHYQNDNLSERYQRSVRNSELSQMTQKQVYQQHYFYNDRKILKKGRKSVFVENSLKRQITEDPAFFLRVN